ncbi:MAG: FmdB family zinc ribbon protein [Cyclonatronaceae bacterium]
MPTYLYKREDGTTFEITQKITEEALKTCPETGQAVKRVITGGGGVVYKGSGWYVTDYKNGSGSATSGKDREKDTGSGHGSSAHGRREDSGTTAQSGESSRASGNGPASNGSSGKNHAGA